MFFSTLQIMTSPDAKVASAEDAGPEAPVPSPPAETSVPGLNQTPMGLAGCHWRSLSKAERKERLLALLARQNREPKIATSTGPVQGEYALKLGMPTFGFAAITSGLIGPFSGRTFENALRDLGSLRERQSHTSTDIDRTNCRSDAFFCLVQSPYSYSFISFGNKRELLTN